MNSPLISIIVPCYDQAQYLDECLQSVLNQTYTNWECIIVNDGSPDNTEEISLKWTEKDIRFKYLKKENGGLSSARNAGIEIAKGEWIQFLDCDDILLSSKFEHSLNSIQKFTELVITDFQLLHPNKKVEEAFCDLSKYEITYKIILTRWDIDFNIPIHCALFKTKSLNNIKFNENLNSKEDWIFWLKYLEIPKEIKFIDEELVIYRVNPHSVGTDPKLISLANELLYIDLTEESKKLLFEKLNFQLMNSELNLNNCLKALRKIESTKILIYYRKLRLLFLR